MIFCVTAHRWIKDHHHRKMGMLIVQNGCGWGGVFIFICLLLLRTNFEKIFYVNSMVKGMKLNEIK